MLVSIVFAPFSWQVRAAVGQQLGVHLPAACRSCGAARPCHDLCCRTCLTLLCWSSSISGSLSILLLRLPPHLCVQALRLALLPLTVFPSASFICCPSSLLTVQALRLALLALDGGITLEPFSDYIVLSFEVRD